MLLFALRHLLKGSGAHPQCLVRTSVLRTAVASSVRNALRLARYSPQRYAHTEFHDVRSLTGMQLQEQTCVFRCRLIQDGGVTLAVDKVSMEFVKGATVEYAEDLLSSSFRVRSARW